MKNILAELEDIQEVNSMDHRACVKLAFMNSVPYGGVDMSEIPTELKPFFNELIKKEYLVVKKLPNGMSIVSTTRRAVFILSSREHLECVAHTDAAWRRYEEQSNVRCAIVGPFHLPHNSPKQKKKR